MVPFLEENFKIINNSKLRMKNKSHCFLRYSNALPRNKDKDCTFCPNEKESINHILFGCNKYNRYAIKLTKILNVFFKLNLICDEIFLIILNQDIRINIFQMINQR